MSNKEETNNVAISTLFDSKSPSTVGAGHGKGGMLTQVETVYNDVKDKFGKTWFMGGFANRDVVGGSNKSMHAYGRAFDIGGSHATMSKIAEYLRTVPGVQYVIYNRRISSKGGEWRPYNGKNAHTDHVHVDFLPDFGGVKNTGTTGSTTNQEESSTSGAGTFQSVGDNLINRFITFSWNMLPFTVGVVILLLTLFSMFLGKKKKIMKKVTK